MTLLEVYQDLERWKKPMKEELESQYSKGSLIPTKIQDLEQLIKERPDLKIKRLPSKLVAVAKRTKDKARIVACGNKEEDVQDKDTYAGGADATKRCCVKHH